MFRFIRSATVRHIASMPAALKYAAEVTSYVREHHGMTMRFGAQMFGGTRVEWHLDFESLDKMTAQTMQLMQDPEYLALIDRNRELWVDGSVTDKLVRLVV